MKETLERLVIVIAAVWCWSWAVPAGAVAVDAASCSRAAAKLLVRLDGPPRQGRPPVPVADAQGEPLYYLVALAPAGFMVIAADTTVPPLVAYSLHDPLPRRADELATFDALLRGLLATFRQAAQLGDHALAARSRADWERLLATGGPTGATVAPVYWPPAGTTATGGWLETNWHQSAPYNAACPVDPVTGNRSIVGCPAVAIAQIMNYHRTTNATRFDDGDDYYHSYGGRNYWIDDDAAARDFPTFPEINQSFEKLEAYYAGQGPITDAERAVLSFAAGVAARQVYTSTVSGTFGVDQAVDAYTRFAVSGIELLGPFAPDLYQRMAANMQQGLPVHLAVLTEDNTAGHNVVTDGYSSDGYFHLNFGWGGTANGWYLLPDGIPYNLTVVEGAIVDINPSGILFRDGFEAGSTIYWSAVVDP